jgi:hypothetical protein
LYLEKFLPTSFLSASQFKVTVKAFDNVEVNTGEVKRENIQQVERKCEMDLAVSIRLSRHCLELEMWAMNIILRFYQTIMQYLSNTYEHCGP